MSACDHNSGSALHKRLRPLIPKPPSNKLIDSQSHYTLTAEVANEACIVGRRDLKKDDLQMARATYFKTSTEILQTQTSHVLRLNPRREAGICRGSSVSSRWNPTTDQLKILEDLYKRGIRTPSAEHIQCITAQLRHYGKIEGKNVFYWFQNHKARERQKRRRRIEMLQLETAPANDSDAAKPSEGIPKRPHECSPHTLSNANTAVVAGPAASNRMNSSSPLYTNILAKEPESLKSFLKLAMPSAWENREEEHRGTNLANCRCPKSVNNRKNISEFTAPVHPIFFTTLKHFQQQNSASIERLRAKADHAGSSGLINDGAQCSKGANRDDGWEFIGPDHIATAECNALRIDDVETLELFPLHSCFSSAEALGSSKPAGSESSVLSCQVEPKSSSSLSGASCTDEKRNSTSSQDNSGFDFGKYDEGVNCSKTYEEEQLTYVKLDEREKPQQKPCQFFHFLPLRM